MDLGLRPYVRMVHMHWTYPRILGLSLLKCCWDSDGNLLQRPYKVRANRAEFYEVHHRRHWRCNALSELAVVSVALHEKLHNGTVTRLPRPPAGADRVVPVRL